MAVMRLGETLKALDACDVTSLQLVEAALSRAVNPGEGDSVFTRIYSEAALRDAQIADRRRREGEQLPLLGIPVSVKDLFDIEGDVTTAGSRALIGEAAATTDAEIVARLRRAGAIIVGRTNMTEFAFSGVGLNPHYGTPLNPFDRSSRRIPGGSSSGAAVSVADGMCVVAIGTDTGGSVRIPAALCGLAGFKPTQRRVPLTGTFPLSSSLDSIGAITHSISDCRLVDHILSGEEQNEHQVDVRSCRFWVPENYVLDGLDDHVRSSFEGALERLSSAGLSVERVPLPVLSEIPKLHAAGTFPGHEGYHLHRERLATDGDMYDPRVRMRLEAARMWDANAYGELQRGRVSLIETFNANTKRADALLWPTVPIVAPRIDELEHDEAFQAVNLLLLRNPTVINLIDGCAATVPCHTQGTPPVGLMIAGRGGSDHSILSISAQIEEILA